MVKWIIASGLVLLVLGTGIAYAAMQLSSSTVTQVCVNDTNGLMRAASVCRAGEHLATIGGGGGVQVTQNGTFTVAAGQTSGKGLPLTGITVVGKCELQTAPPAPFEEVLARVELQAASGKKLDAFGTGLVGDVIQGDSFLTYPVGAASANPEYPQYQHGAGTTTLIATSNGATATITVGASADTSDQACNYLWEAVEVPH